MSCDADFRFLKFIFFSTFLSGSAESADEAILNAWLEAGVPVLVSGRANGLAPHLARPEQRAGIGAFGACHVVSTESAERV